MGFLGSLRARQQLFRCLGDLPANLGVGSVSQYKYFKLNSSLSYKQYSFNLSLLGDPKFAEKGVRGARRWPGGMGPAKSRGPTDRETRGQGSVPKQVQKPSRCMSFRECSLRCRRTACACVCSRLSLSGHREGGGRGDGVHNQRGGTLEPFFFSPPNPRLVQVSSSTR